MIRKTIQYFFIVLMVLPILNSCNAQTPVKTKAGAANTVDRDSKQLVGGGCDGCEIMYVGMPRQIDATDTSAGWAEKGQKLLVTGTVFQKDGRTPASDVVLYYWQTDSEGYYSPRKEMDEKAKRHGHIRGWVKTGTDGRYALYTIRPAAYPGRDIPAHIHVSVKEPGISNEYYIDELVFDDDKLLTGKNRKALENRGGSGILRLIKDGAMEVAEHNIILGLNIPGYPKQAAIKEMASAIKETDASTRQIAMTITASETIHSGLQIGEDNPSFTPYHASGPDKGSRACPVCKYGRFHGIIYFSGDNTDWEKAKKWLVFLERESIRRQKYLKAYFVYGSSKNYSKQNRQQELEKIAIDLNLTHLALTFVPDFDDRETEVYLNKINPKASNTIIIYRNSNIIEKFVNLDPGEQQFNEVSAVLDKTTSKYFFTASSGH